MRLTVSGEIPSVPTIRLSFAAAWRSSPVRSEAA
jgi:hypothetical protein